MKKTKLILLTILSCFIFLACFDLNNPVDPKAASYIGVESVDDDGDGIGSYYDIDEFALSSPPNNSKVSSLTPVLSYKPISDEVVYRVYIEIYKSKDDYFLHDPFIESQIYFNNNNYTISKNYLLEDCTYYWRMRAVSIIEMKEVYTTLWSFTVDVDNEITISPYNGRVISDTTPNLQWSEISGATKYALEISTSINFSQETTLQINNIYNNTYTVQGYLDSGKTYYWRIKAGNTYEWNDWIGPWSFTIRSYFY